jgi:predicted DNA-binding protein
MESKDVQVSVRVPPEMAARLDAIAAEMSERAAGAEISRAAAARRALEKGVEALEAVLGLTPGAAKPSRPKRK